MLSKTIDKKTSIMTFALYSMLIGDIVICTFFDIVGRILNSQAGLALFITMSGISFFTGIYILREYLKKLQIGTTDSPFLTGLAKSTPLILYANLGIMVAIILQMALVSGYSSYFLIAITVTSGTTGCLLFGFRFYKFLTWYKSSKGNIMILAFAIATLFYIVAMASTIILNTMTFSHRPILSTENKATVEPAKFLTPIENRINLYAYAIPVVTAIVPQMIGIAFFLRYFKDKIGSLKFWAIIILPPLLLLISDFLPQIATSAQNFVYLNSEFLLFRVIGTLGWVSSSFVMGYAYLSVARTIQQQTIHSTVINYLMVAAFAEILFPPTLNDAIVFGLYPAFGSIAYCFFIVSAFLFSTGIYSAAISVSEDAKLRHSIRKYAKESKILDTIGSAQLEVEIQNKVIKLVHEQQDSMTRETGVESRMTDNDIRQYLEMVVAEAKSKDSSNNNKSVT